MLLSTQINALSEEIRDRLWIDQREAMEEGPMEETGEEEDEDEDQVEDAIQEQEEIFPSKFEFFEMTLRFKSSTHEGVVRPSVFFLSSSCLWC